MYDVWYYWSYTVQFISIPGASQGLKITIPFWGLEFTEPGLRGNNYTRYPVRNTALCTVRRNLRALLEIQHSALLEEKLHALLEMQHSGLIERNLRALLEIQHSALLKRNLHALSEIQHSALLARDLHALLEKHYSALTEKCNDQYGSWKMPESTSLSLSLDERIGKSIPFGRCTNPKVYPFRQKKISKTTNYAR